MKPSVFVVAILLLGPTLTVSAAQNAALSWIRGECENEIGLLCGGRQDVKECLTENEGSLGRRCGDAVRGESAPLPPARPTATKLETVRPSLPEPAPHAAVPIEIESQYNGKGKSGFQALHTLLEREMPGALREVAARLGLPQYEAGLSMPLHVTFDYDPTYGGIGRVQTVFDGSTTFQHLQINLARWQECPSEPQFRSQLRHEMTHVMLADYFNGVDQDHYTFPNWLDEGLATFVGGEPLLTSWIDADYYHYASRGSDEGNCPMDNDPLRGHAVEDCYPRYYFAVKEIESSSPNAVSKLLVSLRQGTPVEEAIQAQTGANWGEFQEHSHARAKRTYNAMWFWHKARHKLRMWLWCTGAAS